jgi:hypothetical protein
LPDNRGSTGPFLSPNDVLKNLEHPIKTESKEERK